MSPRCEDLMAVRREMMDLLRQQMKALDSPVGLTEAQLLECYVRQNRVQLLREKLQAASRMEMEAEMIADVDDDSTQSAMISAGRVSTGSTFVETYASGLSR